jgi:hypothetical protein
MVTKIVLKWAKRLGAALKWLVDAIKSIKFVYMILFGVAAYLGNGLMEVREQVRNVLDSNPKFVEKITVEKPTIQIVEKCQCKGLQSECQNIVTEAIRKNNEKHHPGFK